jgi:hypothetical protein
MEDAVKVSRALQQLFVGAITVAVIPSVAFAGIDVVVPEPTSALIWLGLLGVGAACGRSWRQE